MRLLLSLVVMFMFVVPGPAFAKKDQDDIDSREVVDQDFDKAAKEADKNLKKMEDTFEDIQKEMKTMEKDIDESIKRLKNVVKLSKKKYLSLKKINKVWDEVLKDHKRLEDGLEELEDLQKALGKFFDNYSKAIVLIGK